MEIILIAAMASNRVIGYRNRIPWHLPGEQKQFRETTWGHAIIMGRKTHESIGRALPGRRNIIVSRNPEFRAAGCEVAGTLQTAYALCRNETCVFNIGGEQLYRKGIHDADTLILTVLDHPVAGDTFFPEISPAEFRLVQSEHVAAAIPYAIHTYCRTCASRRSAPGHKPPLFGG